VVEKVTGRPLEAVIDQTASNPALSWAAGGAIVGSTGAMFSLPGRATMVIWGDSSTNVLHAHHDRRLDIAPMLVPGATSRRSGLRRSRSPGLACHPIR
jgi:hypothetical protein